MLSRPHSRLLLCVFTLLALTHASWFDGLNGLLQHYERRAILPDEPSSSVVHNPHAAATPTDDPESTTASPTPTPPKSTPESTPPSSTPATTPTTKPATTPPKTSDTSTATSSQDSTSTPESTEPPKSTADTTASQSVNVVTQVSTVSGSVITSISSSTNDATPTATNAASLANTGTKSSGGMDSKTKKIVIGVVVGVGGALIVAGLAAVAFRIWGRKKKDDDNDDLMGYRAGSAAGEKTSAQGPASNPFQSTLESYHNPAKNVNASSNF